MKHELEMFSLGNGGIDTGLMQVESHVHLEGKICISIIMTELRNVGPLQLPFPIAIIRASQHWDGGGARLNPGLY